MERSNDRIRSTKMLERSDRFVSVKTKIHYIGKLYRLQYVDNKNGLAHEYLKRVINISIWQLTEEAVFKKCLWLKVNNQEITNLD